jgi:type IV pilus assembly protein PilP
VTAARITALVAVLLALAGCDDPVQVGRSAGPVAPTGPQPTPSLDVDAGPGPGQALDGGLVIPVYRDEDFVEADTNRDPFRSYARMFTVRPAEPPQRTVLLPTTGLDQMRLIAIISGVAQPRAMIVDPAGVGHVVERGDYIGRPEVVQTGGTEGMPVTLNWRVDRIRPNEVVLTREDPTAPNRPPLTRVIPLHEEEQAGAR